MSKLHISSDLSLPKEAVTQTFAILAKRGVGKTYTASVMAEEMLKASLQVVVVDPIGVWWGLRASADGKHEGLEIIVMGGEHGDVPLESTGGELVADFVVEHGRSVVLDLSSFRKGEMIRFMTAFAETLYRRNRAPLHLIVDEADAFAPQKTMRGEGGERLLGAMEDIVRRGRARGLGVTLVTQRAAVLNKNVLTQIEVLVCLRTISPQDREAVEAWVHAHDFTAEQWTAFVESLPTLRIGEAWFWSPGWLEIFKKVKVRKRETFDSSATPKVGEKVFAPKHLKPVDLASLREKMAATIEQAKANDPKELKRKIIALERERSQTLQKLTSDKAARVEIIEKPILKDSQIDRFGKLCDFAALNEGFEKRMAAAIAPYADRLLKIDESMQSILQVINKVRDGVTPLARSPRRPLPRPRIPERTLAGRPTSRASVSSVRSPPASGDTDVSLGIGERRCAIAIAQHPNGVMREQLTTLTGYKRSTRNTYLQRLLAAGFVTQNGERFAITEAGIDWIGSDYQPLPTGVELQRYWLQKLPEGESKIFAAVLARPEIGVTREQLGEETCYKRSTRNTYIQRLAARELVEINGETIWPSETLFGAA